MYRSANTNTSQTTFNEIFDSWIQPMSSAHRIYQCNWAVHKQNTVNKPRTSKHRLPGGAWPESFSWPVSAFGSAAPGSSPARPGTAIACAAIPRTAQAACHTQRSAPTRLEDTQNTHTGKPIFADRDRCNNFHRQHRVKNDHHSYWRTTNSHWGRGGLGGGKEDAEEEWWGTCPESCSDWNEDIGLRGDRVWLGVRGPAPEGNGRAGEYCPDPIGWTPADQPSGPGCLEKQSATLQNLARRLTDKIMVKTYR